MIETDKEIALNLSLAHACVRDSLTVIKTGKLEALLADLAVSFGLSILLFIMDSSLAVPIIIII